MRRYTTPTLPVFVQGIDLTEFDVYVTLAQRTHVKTVNADDMEYNEEGNTRINVDLSQFETAEFREGAIKLQVNWVDTEGKRYATNEATIQMCGNLLEEVIA